MYTQVVQVANAAPVLTGLNSSASTIGSASQGSTVTISGSFKDAGVLDTHSAVIDWGDGTTSAAKTVDGRGTGQFSGTHVYASGGMYNVTVRLADNATTPASPPAPRRRSSPAWGCTTACSR